MSKTRYCSILLLISGFLILSNIQTIELDASTNTGGNTISYCLEKMAQQQQTSIEKLEEIDCQNMNITSLVGINQATNLKSIDVSNNQLTHLSVDLFSLQKVEELYVMNNAIPFIPEGIKNFKHLKILDISGNRLTFIPAVIQQLTTLKTLDVSTNRIVSIPAIDTLRSLEELYLNDNQLIQLPSLKALALKQLTVHNNLLKNQQVATLNQTFSVSEGHSFSIVEGTHLFVNKTWDGDLKGLEQSIVISNGQTFTGLYSVVISNIYTASGSMDNIDFYFDRTSQEIKKSATVYATVMLTTDTGTAYVNGDLPISFIAATPPSKPGSGSGGGEENIPQRPGETIITIPATDPTILGGIPVADLNPGETVIQEIPIPVVPDAKLSTFFISNFGDDETVMQWWEFMFHSEFLLSTSIIIVLLIPVTLAFLLFTKIRRQLIKMEKDFF